MFNTVFVTLVESGQNWPISPKLEHFFGGRVCDPQTIIKTRFGGVFPRLLSVLTSFKHFIRVIPVQTANKGSDSTNHHRFCGKH